MTIRGPAWDAKFAVSKFWGADRFAQPTEGDRVMLTDHGGKVTYKDFKFVVHQPPQDTPQTLSPPFLGNAMRNGWADQNSIVIWTRTTATADMITAGPKFQSVKKSDVAKLSNTSDVDKLHAAQIPPGAKLEEMFGACPGAAGEVRLTYFVQRQTPKSTAWKQTTA